MAPTEKVRFYPSFLSFFRPSVRSVTNSDEITDYVPQNLDSLGALVLRRRAGEAQRVLQAHAQRRRYQPAAVGAAVGQRFVQATVLVDRGAGGHAFPGVPREQRGGGSEESDVVECGGQHRGVEERCDGAD